VATIARTYINSTEL